MLFGICDTALTALAFEAAYQTRVYLPFERVFYLTVRDKALLLGAAILAWLLIAYLLQLYDRLPTAAPRAVFRETLRQCLLGSIVIVLFEFTVRLDLSRVFLALFAAYSCLFLSLFRFNAATLFGRLRREFSAPHYVVVVGVGERARRMGRLLERSAPYGVRLLAFVRPGLVLAPDTLQLKASYPVYPLESLTDILRTHVVDDVVFAVDSRDLASLEEVFLLCDEEGVRTHLSIDFFPHVHSSVYLDQVGTATMLTFSATPHDEVMLFLKRLTDITIAAVGLIVLSPLMGLIAVLVKLTSSGPVLFRQVRCGLNGRRFTCYKFRSMVNNAEAMLATVAHLNEKQTAFKIRQDPRLTPVGRFLRKFSLDELPQLWNVLRGEMSLVGPRPAIPEEVERYKRWHRRRLRMRPGLTCLWAIAGRSELDFETWMKLDMQYIDRWSLALDWHILFRTIPQVILGKGAH